MFSLVKLSGRQGWLTRLAHQEQMYVCNFLVEKAGSSWAPLTLHNSRMPQQ